LPVIKIVVGKAIVNVQIGAPAILGGRRKASAGPQCQ